MTQTQCKNKIDSITVLNFENSRIFSRNLSILPQIRLLHNSVLEIRIDKMGII